MDRLLRVLLVDDERAIRTALQRVLAGAGFEVVAAASGEQALVVLSGAPPFDVVLTDLEMPTMRGSELVLAIRKVDPEIPIVVLTGHCSAQQIESLLGSGASNCVGKPISGDQLVKALHEAMRGQPGVRNQAAVSGQHAIGGQSASSGQHAIGGQTAVSDGDATNGPDAIRNIR